MSVLSQLRSRLKDQLRTLHESGNRQDGGAFRKRWAKRFANELLRSPADAIEFIEGKISHEIQAQSRALKLEEGRDFGFTPDGIGAMVSMTSEDKDTIGSRKLKDIWSRINEFNRLADAYNFSEAYRAFLEGEHDEDRQRKLAKLDSLIRSL